MGEYRAVPGKVLSCAGFLDRAEAGGHPGKEWLRQERGAQLICTWEYVPGIKKRLPGLYVSLGFLCSRSGTSRMEGLSCMHNRDMHSRELIIGLISPRDRAFPVHVSPARIPAR